MSNPSPFPDPNQEKKLFGDANLLKIHSPNDTTKEANEENKDHNPKKPDFLKNLSKEHRDTSSNDTGEDVHKKSTDHKQKKHDPLKNLFEDFKETASLTTKDGNKRKYNDAHILGDLNDHISNDDIGVKFGKNNSNSDATIKLTIEQKRRAYKDIRTFVENERLNQLNRKIANDRLRDKGIDPEKFRDTGIKLYNLLEADRNGKMVSTTDFEITYKKFNRMVQKLGDIDKKIVRNYF